MRLALRRLRPMSEPPKDGTPVMLKLRDVLGVYEAGPFAWRDGGWWSVGGKRSHPLAGNRQPIGWRPIEKGGAE